MANDELQKYRGEINAVDREMAELFCRRMEISEKIGSFKAEHSLPVLNAERENEVIARNSAALPCPGLRAYYIRFLKGIMRLSRDYQAELTNGKRVSYTGVEGAFAQIAAHRIFPGASLSPYGDFRQAYDSVADGECDCCVLPVENSTVGDVGQVIDLMYSGGLHVNGIYNLPVCQNLIGLEGATPYSIKTVVSHPQALGQCADYLKAHSYRCVEASNTAAAAKQVAESKDSTTAAIASAETAEIYGLRVLEHNINGSGVNATRFAVLSAAPCGSGADESIVFFTVRNEAGALAKAISIIGKYGFNMKGLRSRPKKDSAWQYYFYAELEGNVSGDSGAAMLAEMKGCCDSVKVAGTFSEYNLA